MGRAGPCCGECTRIIIYVLDAEDGWLLATPAFAAVRKPDKRTSVYEVQASGEADKVDISTPPGHVLLKCTRLCRIITHITRHHKHVRTWTRSFQTGLLCNRRGNEGLASVQADW